jgi:hypothetical protein
MSSVVVRLSLAAAVSLGLCAGAGAATIEGVVAFPSRLVPSMTVYASEVETSRIHTAPLARGQTNFTLELPPGRYLVFLSPNEPGAPNVYGAFTRYSLCSPHDTDGQCEDHTLIPVAVAAKSARISVTIDDWYLTDEVAAQIDRIRGVADIGAARDPEAFGAPRFSEYPSESLETPAAPKLDFSGREVSEEEREMVMRALGPGPNFAGHLTATVTRCGPGCSRLLLVDWTTGAIHGLPAQPAAAETQELPCRPDEALLFRRDSRLMSVSRVRGTTVVTQYYVWNQKTAALVQSVEYQRTPQTFCAVAARSARSCDD